MSATIKHIDNCCYLYSSTLFIPFTAMYYILHLSYTLRGGGVTLRINHSFIQSEKNNQILTPITNSLHLLQKRAPMSVAT